MNTDENKSEHMDENAEVRSESESNLIAAVNKVASTMDMTISNAVGDDGPATKQIIVRASDIDHERWKNAAHHEGKSMAQFIRDVMNDAVKEILDCTHPLHMRKSYKWAEFCTKCNTRLRG
jgi:hypothetical protein